LGACNKDDSSKQQLPLLTQEGQNILACKVNEQVRIFKGKGSIPHDVGVNYYRFVDQIVISCNNESYEHIRMTIPVIPDSVKVGVRYNFSKSEIINPYASYYKGNGSIVYMTDIQSGFIEFTRLDKSIAAGIFEFTAHYNNDLVKITEGRFDITNP
jgi:hypothetical protein